MKFNLVFILILSLIHPWLSLSQDNDLFPNNLDEIEKDFINQTDSSSNRSLKDLRDITVQISLQDAIEGGLRNNYDEKNRKYQFQLNEIFYQDAHDDFYFPNINLTMATTSDHHIENFYRDTTTNASSPKTPHGHLGIEIEDYTLFNWGKDYLDYLNAKEEYARTKENLAESKRDLRLKIILSYFELAKTKEIVKIYKKQLSHASFIYRLAKEKLTLRKIKSQEFLEAKSLFLAAHKDYHQALYLSDKSQVNLIQILGEDHHASYNTVNILRYSPLNVTEKESLTSAIKNARALLDAKAQMNIANRSFEKAQKENLPLPKFSVKLGTYRRNFTGGNYSDDYETFAGSKNIEVAASLNMTWRLYGSGGFFNYRKQEGSYYSKKMSELNLEDAKREVNYINRLTHSQIRRLENRYKAVAAQRKNARSVFDQTIDNYISSKTHITNVRQVLEELKTSSVELEETKLSHLSEKLNLAQLMGVDDFAGEKFERLIEQ